ncbi:MAG: UDP-N-acetylmuramoyl-tripeptide--D-alanyl-D-alanine ligase [Salibacteraceae bacterium]
MNIEAFYSKFLESNKISTDTRSISSGCMFFALKGENFNGNRFAKQALDSGARYSIIDEKEFYLDKRTILVDDVLKALQDLAAFHRTKFDIPFIAITGSNGKTTTKELLNAVLGKKFKVAYTKGNFNNHIGVPLTLLDISKNDEIALIEMGDNHPKEVEFLCEIARPTHGFVTNVGKDHLEGFGSFENNVLAKKEVFDYLQKTNGVAFVDESDALVKEMVDSSINKITYGLYDSYSYLKFLAADPVVRFKTINGKEVGTNLFGAFNFNNFKLAFCIGEYFDVPESLIIDALRSYLPDNNRSQVVLTERNEIILDAYNANPSSVEEAVISFGEMKTNKSKFLFLGDMFELGSYAEEEHQYIADLTKKWDFSQVVLVGENYAKVKNVNGINVFAEKEEAEVYIKKIAPEGAIILLKGSRGMRMETFKDFL